MSDEENQLEGGNEARAPAQEVREDVPIQASTEDIMADTVLEQLDDADPLQEAIDDLYAMQRDPVGSSTKENQSQEIPTESNQSSESSPEEPEEQSHGYTFDEMDEEYEEGEEEPPQVASMPIKREKEEPPMVASIPVESHEEDEMPQVASPMMPPFSSQGQSAALDALQSIAPAQGHKSDQGNAPLDEASDKKTEEVAPEENQDNVVAAPVPSFSGFSIEDNEETDEELGFEEEELEEFEELDELEELEDQGSNESPVEQQEEEEDVFLEEDGPFVDMDDDETLEDILEVPDLDASLSDSDFDKMPVEGNSAPPPPREMEPEPEFEYNDLPQDDMASALDLALSTAPQELAPDQKAFKPLDNLDDEDDEEDINYITQSDQFIIEEDPLEEPELIFTFEDLVQFMNGDQKAAQYALSYGKQAVAAGVSIPVNVSVRRALAASPDVGAGMARSQDQGRGA